MLKNVYYPSIFITVLILLASPALASISCYGCHGTSNPIDFRPVDAPFRNPSSGGFQGNHRTHLNPPSSPTDCAKCHPGSESFTSSHRVGNIKVSSKINGSPTTTEYHNYTSAWQQTATPGLGKCSSVNCHFEKTTPTWGAPDFTSPGDCNRCHGASPTDGNHPYGAQKHATYYGTTTTSCIKCHSDHTADPAPFAHATSARNRGLNIQFNATPHTGGSYSGMTSYPAYLPSQAPPRNGTCINIYCHSPGNKTSNFDPPNQTATWGGLLSCNGCHKDGAGDPIVSGSHPIHLLKGYGCVVCHADTVSNNTTIKNIAKGL